MKRIYHIGCIITLVFLFTYCTKSAEKDSTENVITQVEDSNTIGIWHIQNYVDDFNENTNDKFITTKVNGQFKNQDNTNFDLHVRFIIDTKRSEIQLFEFNNNLPVSLNGSLLFKIKESDGSLHDIATYSGVLISTDSMNTDSLFKAILSRDGEIKFTATLNEYGSENTYNFSLPNDNHFKDALAKLKGKTKYNMD